MAEPGKVPIGFSAVGDRQTRLTPLAAHETSGKESRQVPADGAGAAAGTCGTGSETLAARGGCDEPLTPRTTQGIGAIPPQAWRISEKQHVAPGHQNLAAAEGRGSISQFSEPWQPATPGNHSAQTTERRFPDPMADTAGPVPAKEARDAVVDKTAPNVDGTDKPGSTSKPAPGLENVNANAFNANRNLPGVSFAAAGPRSPLTHPNGVPIFPDLSTEQQLTESSEATTQAESSIVADSDEVASIFDGTEPSDDGYGSDVATNASTSIESSVRDYMYENGRRYHRFREGQYNFPNDEMEQEREDMKHAMVKLLCNQTLNFAPIGDWPQQILDVGTGTGAWAIEMGDRYESATVLGVDLSPIQPDWVPPNVRFEVDDVESAWLYPRNHFDYIHSRHTVMAIKDWGSLFQKSMEHLRPGGWIELQEIHHFPLSAGNAMSAAHPVAQYWGYVVQGLSNLGIDLNAAAGDRLPNMMREAGFINVTERVFHVPIGTWPRNRVLKTVGMYWRTILLDGLQAIALGPFTRGLHWSAEQTEMFLMGVRRAYHDTSALMYMPLRIMYAQKPTNMR